MNLEKLAKEVEAIISEWCKGEAGTEYIIEGDTAKIAIVEDYNSEGMDGEICTGHLLIKQNGAFWVQLQTQDPKTSYYQGFTIESITTRCSMDAETVASHFLPYLVGELMIETDAILNALEVYEAENPEIPQPELDGKDTFDRDEIY